MPTVLRTPGATGLSEVVSVLRDWQHDGAPVQLHPGDLGWHWRFGAEATAAAVRTWIRDGQILAVGLIDGPRLVRLAVAPEADQDEELARRIVTDVTRPERGVLPPGPAYVEARRGRLLRDLLAERGWEPDEPWAPLCRDLSDPVAGCGLRIEVTGADQVRARAAVQPAFRSSGWFRCLPDGERAGQQGLGWWKGRYSLVTRLERFGLAGWMFARMIW